MKIYRQTLTCEFKSWRVKITIGDRILSAYWNSKQRNSILNYLDEKQLDGEDKGK